MDKQGIREDGLLGSSDNDGLRLGGRVGCGGQLYAQRPRALHRDCSIVTPEIGLKVVVPYVKFVFAPVIVNVPEAPKPSVAGLIDVMTGVVAGVGVGVKKYNVVFVFETEQALARFLDSGWAGETQADAAAKTSKSGGAYSGAASIAPGVWVYQITKKGLALQLTLQGTKYSKDNDLNKK